MSQTPNGDVTSERPSEILNSLLADKPRGAQAALAKALGVRPQTITKWVNGDVQVPTERWLDVERALEVPLLTFAERTGLLEHVPDFRNIPEDRLDIAWAASMGRGKRRAAAKAEAREGEHLVLTLDETAERFNAWLNEVGLEGLNDDALLTIGPDVAPKELLHAEIRRRLETRLEPDEVLRRIEERLTQLDVVVRELAQSVREVLRDVVDRQPGAGAGPRPDDASESVAL